MEVHIVYMMLVCLETNAHIDAKSKEKVKVRKSVEYFKAAEDYVNS